MKNVSIVIIVCLLATLNIHASPLPAGENQAVILMYHRFGENTHPSTNIRLEQFDTHLDYLEQNGYQIWPLKKVVQHIKDKKPFPGRVAALTVDDAYESVYTEAYPRLRKRNWPFTVFVATDGVDKGFKSYMSWQQMREMKKHGATLANHSGSHSYLIRRLHNETPKQWKHRVTQDIQRAEKRLKEELGTSPKLFAYPYGEYNTELSTILSSMGYVAFGQHSGPAGITDDLRALPRFPMAEKFAALSGFREKLNTLAFPIQNQNPWDPVLGTTNNPPTLKITLGDSDARLDQLKCYVPGQGRVDIKWINRQQKIFSVQARSPLPNGRSRYNCTAPSSQKERFYWFSQLWINPPAGKP